MTTDNNLLAPNSGPGVMSMERKIAILKTYGNIFISDQVIPVVVWLHNDASQRSCSGKGNTVDEAVDDLYTITEIMMISCIRALLIPWRN